MARNHGVDGPTIHGVDSNGGRKAAESELRDICARAAIHLVIHAADEGLRPSSEEVGARGDDEGFNRQ